MFPFMIFPGILTVFTISWLTFTAMFMVFSRGPNLPKWTGVEYRIAMAKYSGYSVQQRVWFWNFWVDCGFSNTFSSIDDAKAWMIRFIETGCSEEILRFKP